MRLSFATPDTRAITRNEVLVIVVLVLFLGTLLFYGVFVKLSVAKAEVTRIKCVSRHKQIGLAFRVWANDHDDKYPFYSPLHPAGPPPVANPVFMNDTDAWLHFVTMSNELGSAKLLVCPGDRERLKNMCMDYSTNAIAPNFGLQFQQNRAVSYFINLEGGEMTPQVVLAGDRDLETNARTLRGSVLFPDPARPPAWLKRHHSGSRPGGNVALSDGSVQQMMDAGLSNAVVQGQDALGPTRTNRFLMPLSP